MAITDQMITTYQHPRIKLVVGNTTIYEDDLVSGSFSYRGGTTGGGEFAPGGCVISSASFTLYNRTGGYTNLISEGTEITIYIGYGASPSTATYDMLCTVYAAKVIKRSYKINVQAYDKLRDADKKKWTTFNFPMTVNQIITAAATEAGITVSQLPSAGGSISVDLRDADGNQPNLSMTCRQAIAQALLISGNFGYMTPAGLLYCGWYSASYDKDIPHSWLFDYSMSDSQNYTGVQVYGQTPTGSSDRLFVLSSGKFITEDNCQAIQARLYTALVGINVRTGTFVATCNPNIHPGQIVQVVVPQAGGTLTFIVPITAVTVKGSLKATYTCETISADEADDLRSDGLVNKDDVEKAIEDATKGATGQIISLPGVRVICAKSGDDEVLGHYDGFTAEMDQWQQTGAVWTNRNIAGRSTTAIGTLAGIEIMNVTYPAQKITVPANNGDSCFVDMLITRIKSPILSQYRTIYGSSVTNSQWKARVCNFDVSTSHPYRVTVKCTRNKGTSGSGAYDTVSFEAVGIDPNVGQLNRPTTIYSGFERKPMAASSSGSEPYIYRLPITQIPLPGSAFDLLTNKWSQMDNYCDYENLYPI